MTEQDIPNGENEPELTDPTPDPFTVLEALRAENAELKDRALRALAETENMRRRTEKDVADARVYAVSNFARDLLSVVDNLERALSSLPESQREEMEGVLKSLVEGVDLTARDMTSVLARHGVKRIDPNGEKFDPHFHQAMFEAPSETVPQGCVVQVVQSGWKISDRVLRPALVGVSKGASAASA